MPQRALADDKACRVIAGNPDRQPVGLVLSGGGAHDYAHLGVLNQNVSQQHAHNVYVQLGHTY